MGFFTPKNTPENAVKAQIDAKLAFINEKYTEIGRFVKLKMADQIEAPEVKNLIAQIDATLAELKGLNEQLLTIRGVKLCTNCGHEIPVTTAFCPDCGTKQPAQNQNPNQNMQGGAAVPMGQPAQNFQPQANFVQPMNQVMGNPVEPGYTPPVAHPVNGEVRIDAPTPASVQPAAEPQEVAQPVSEPVINEAPQEVVQASAPVQNEQPVQPAQPVQPTQGQFIFCSQCGHKEPATVKFCSNCGSKL